MRILNLTLAVALLLAASPAALALSNPGDIRKFHGVWIGKGVVAEKQLKETTFARRDIDIVIRKTKIGFEITWKTLTREGAKRITTRFVAGSEPDTFEANQVSPPLTGKEKLWAQFEGDRLVVYLSGVGDDGVEGVARYECSVADGLMTLKYTLSRGGELLESVTGKLTRAKVVL